MVAKARSVSMLRAFFYNGAHFPSQQDPIMSNTDDNDTPAVRDSNGNLLANGDSVQLIKDLKVKGTSVTLKRGTIAKNIHLTDDDEEIECNVDKVKGLVLKTAFLKKV
jgi:protein PhnA